MAISILFGVKISFKSMKWTLGSFFDVNKQLKQSSKRYSYEEFN